MRRQAASEGRGRGSARARAVNGVLKSRRCAHSPPVLHANGIRRRGRDAGGDILAPRRRNRQLGLAGLAILELRRAPRHGGAATRAHHREGRGAAPVDLNDDARGRSWSRPTSEQAADFDDDDLGQESKRVRGVRGAPTTRLARHQVSPRARLRLGFSHTSRLSLSLTTPSLLLSLLLLLLRHRLGAKAFPFSFLDARV